MVFLIHLFNFYCTPTVCPWWVDSYGPCPHWASSLRAASHYATGADPSLTLARPPHWAEVCLTYSISPVMIHIHLWKRRWVFGLPRILLSPVWGMRCIIKLEEKKSRLLFPPKNLRGEKKTTKQPQTIWIAIPVGQFHNTSEDTVEEQCYSEKFF